MSDLHNSLQVRALKISCPSLHDMMLGKSRDEKVERQKKLLPRGRMFFNSQSWRSRRATLGRRLVLRRDLLGKTVWAREGELGERLGSSREPKSDVPCLHYLRLLSTLSGMMSKGQH